MAADLVQLVNDIRATGGAFRELLALIEEKFAPDAFVDCLGVVLCDRIEQLGEQLEAAIQHQSLHVECE
ncbi:MAG: hypothetical protein KBH81_14750 [Phycisphaerae bacterium]|nr:hypothetical protein [Phycisphaerae bacterium]